MKVDERAKFVARMSERVRCTACVRLTGVDWQLRGQKQTLALAKALPSAQPWSAQSPRRNSRRTSHASPRLAALVEQERPRLSGANLPLLRLEMRPRRSISPNK